LRNPRQDSARIGILATRRAVKQQALHERQDEYDSFGVVETTVAECQAAGSMDPDADPAALSLHAWAEVHGLALLRNEGLIAGMSEMRGGNEKSTLDAIFAIMRARFKA
jgi:hypothetical protein